MASLCEGELPSHQRVGEEEGLKPVLLAIVIDELQELRLLRIVRGRVRDLIEADDVGKQRCEKRGHTHALRREHPSNTLRVHHDTPGIMVRGVAWRILHIGDVSLAPYLARGLPLGAGEPWCRYHCVLRGSEEACATWLRERTWMWEGCGYTSWMTASSLRTRETSSVGPARCASGARCTQSSWRRETT